MKRILLVVLLTMLLAYPSKTYADIAPPAQPPGSNLQPGDEVTQVRMLAETVLIEVQSSAPGKSLGQAHVSADFTMHNLGQAAESMAARFPIGASDGFFSVNELRDLQIKVNDRLISARRIMGEDPYQSSTQVPWAEFDASFPPGQDTQVQVKYTLEASGEYPFIWFKYILASGAGWKDSIGSVDIIVRLPYEANNQNLLLDTADAWFGTTKDGVINGNEIRWHYTDLEPTVENNFEINLVMPSAWENLLAEQNRVRQNPNDGEAWGQVGKLCKQMAFSSRGKGFRSANILDPGAAELYRLSLQAYEKAVTLLPDDALWHAGYADLLAYHAYFDAFNGHDTNAEALHGLSEIRAALELSPNDPKVQEIADEIAYFFPDGIQRQGAAFDFPWLTATPVLATETSRILLATPTPEAPTAQPESASPTPTTEIPASKPSLPVCGSAMLIPILASFVACMEIRGRSGTKKRKCP